MTSHVIVALAVSVVTLAAAEVPLDSVLSHPQKCDRQRVTVSGFARVDGESFVLYGDAASAKQLDKRALSVAQRRGKPFHHQLNNHWVTATGIIDAKARGLWGFPCELLLEEAHAVRHQ